MLDKGLYREVSDLLDLQVDDDKIVRILLVQGFTTEQIKRAVKDIRTKQAPIAVKEARHEPVSETIEAGASKRVGMLNKMFGKETEAQIVAEETRKYAEEEVKIKAEEKKLVEHSDEIMAQNQKTIPADVKKVLKMMDRLLGEMPEAEVKKFARSEEFDIYRDVLKRYL